MEADLTRSAKTPTAAAGHLHFVGMGGAGMCALAEVLLRRGRAVSGCDVRDSGVLQRLRDLGARVWVGHDRDHLEGCAGVIASRAVSPDTAEIAAAREAGLPVWHRAQMLAEILAGERLSVGVVGTHGKTTTAALLSAALTGAGHDPTALVGAEVREFGSHARVGSGPAVAEVDESDGSLVFVRVHSTILTSLDLTDHADHYGDVGALLSTFRRFLAGLDPGGFALLCADHPNVLRLREAVPCRAMTYGLDRGEFSARVIERTGVRSRFAFLAGGRELGEVRLRLPGRHNITNAVAALAAGLHIGAGFAPMAQALGCFRGVRRRFDVHCEAPLVVDDYAHNPVKVRSFLRGLREGWPEARIVAVFQPHRYSRTRTTHAQYARAFDDADELIVTEIYPADEAPLPGVSGRLIVDAVAPHRPVRWIPEIEDVPAAILPTLRPGDVVATMGAGDIWKVAEWIASGLRSRG
ncbi:MAG: UDP-N-acetylmuramate--L-alanine ligase [Armatimonadota bacterium]|nr:UDP-N-acetylmuramate--L-alanine ligase [Armatimonadota bacterium]MDR5696681.1 UDP-N-acetylmuramate--L-alanine ligase [Armatimonadota bacterium]